MLQRGLPGQIQLLELLVQAGRSWAVPRQQDDVLRSIPQVGRAAAGGIFSAQFVELVMEGTSFRAWVQPPRATAEMGRESWG